MLHGIETYGNYWKLFELFETALLIGRANGIQMQNDVWHGHTISEDRTTSANFGTSHAQLQLAPTSSG
jgi:hypothetical protein